MIGDLIAAALALGGHPVIRPYVDDSLSFGKRVGLIANEVKPRIVRKSERSNLESFYSGAVAAGEGVAKSNSQPRKRSREALAKIPRQLRFKIEDMLIPWEDSWAISRLGFQIGGGLFNPALEKCVSFGNEKVEVGLGQVFKKCPKYTCADFVRRGVPNVFGCKFYPHRVSITRPVDADTMNFDVHVEPRALGQNGSFGTKPSSSERDVNQHDANRRQDCHRDGGPEHCPRPKSHSFLGRKVPPFALGILICVGISVVVLGFQCAAYAAKVRRDFGILCGAVIALIGAGVASAAFTYWLSGP